MGSQAINPIERTMLGEAIPKKHRQLKLGTFTTVPGTSACTISFAAGP